MNVIKQKGERKMKGVKNNGQAYLIEAAGLAGFVIVAGLTVIFLEHPSLPVMHGVLSQHLATRRIILALVMGVYIAAVTAWFGQSTGAQFNPAVTVSFLCLGKMTLANSAGYIAAQLAGAASGILLLSWFTGGLFSHPLINYSVTEPKVPHGMMGAFIAECIISFILMFSVLATASSNRFEKYVPLLSGVCIFAFIAVELPFSGMSMNPARSIAASLAAGKWKYIWIYIVAPVISMLAATEIFSRWKKNRSLFSGTSNTQFKMSNKNEDYREIPAYPIISM